MVSITPVMLLREQIRNTQSTARDLVGVMRTLPEGSAARAWAQSALKTLIVSFELMTEAVEEMEKDL